MRHSIPTCATCRAIGALRLMPTAPGTNQRRDNEDFSARTWRPDRTVFMRRYTFAIPLLVLVSTSACSSDKATSADATSTISSGSASAAEKTSAASAPSTSTSPPSTTEVPSSSWSSAAPTTSPGQGHTPSVVPPAESTAAATGQPRRTRPSATTFTCHYEEGDAPCNASEYAINKTAWPAYQAQNNGGTTSASRSSQTSDVARDANGFALGGPPRPSLAEHPTKTQCTTYRDALVAWSNYQDQHRPAGSTNLLPMSGEVQNLAFTCNLTYPATP